MKTDYKDLDFEVYVRLHDLQGILDYYQVEDDYSELVNRHMELIRTKQFRVAVIEGFDQENSGLLNALLGEKSISMDVTPATATINRIAYDKGFLVEIIDLDGSAEEMLQQQKSVLIESLQLLIGAGKHLENWYGEKKERLEKRLQEARERKKQIDDYFTSLLNDTKKTIGEHILPTLEYVSVQGFSAKFEGICIEGLSAIDSDDEASIMDGIQKIDLQINRYTKELMQMKQEQLRSHVKKCLEELVKNRENRFCMPMSDFSPEEADNRRQMSAEVWQRLEEAPETCDEHYQFLVEYQRPYVLADTALQNKTDFFLTDARHCNYIAFMNESTKKHAAAIEKWFSGWKTKYVDKLWELQRKDEGEKEDILTLAGQWVTDCEEEILLNRKLYEKHREQLLQMENYAKETINSIQAEEM